MIDTTLLKSVLTVSVASSIISTALIQVIKESLNSTKYIFIIGLVISMTLGVAFSLSFTDLNITNSLWVGLISFIGADVIYKTFEDKLFFSSLGSDNNPIVIERPEEL